MCECGGGCFGGSCGGGVASVPCGALSPLGLQVTVERCDASLDLSTVTSAALRVKRPDGITRTWDATITAQETEELAVQHLFSAGEVPLPGTYSVVPLLTTAGGTYPGAPVLFEVD